MQTRRLGRTGHHSSVAILGGAAFARSNPAATEAAFHMAIERGVNHLDIAPSYGDAEVLVGPFVPAVRDRLFVAGKTGRHNADGVRAQLETTLQRLQTDYLDLYQLHGVTSVEELDRRGDAAQVLLQAREEGIVRFVGITGHDLGAPSAHHEALRRYDFDTVMFPVYPGVWRDPVYRGDAEQLLAACAERDAGVMAIKAVARRPWGDDERETTTWYRPFTDADGIRRGVHFALSTPGVQAFCTPSDISLLPLVFDAADSFEGVEVTDSQRESVMAGATEPLIFPMPR